MFTLFHVVLFSPLLWMSWERLSSKKVSWVSNYSSSRNSLENPQKKLTLFLFSYPSLPATLLPSYSLVSKHGLPNHSPPCCTPPTAAIKPSTSWLPVPSGRDSRPERGGPPSYLKKITKLHSNSPKALLNILQQVSLSHSSINPTKLISQWPTRRRHVATRDSDTWQNWAAEKRAPNGGLQKGLLHFTSQYIMYFAYYPFEFKIEQCTIYPL